MSDYPQPLTTPIARPSSSPKAPESDGAARRPSSNGRLVAWLVLVGFMVVTSFAPGGDDALPPDRLFRYSTAALLIIQWAVIAVPVVLILRGRPTGEMLALRQPRSWRWALVAGAAILVADYALTVVYDGVLGPFDEGTIAAFWDSSRAGQFATSFLAVVVLGPIFEEVMFRGLGYGLLEPFGTGVAIVVTGVLFALMHGYLTVLPVFIAYGIAMGWLRSRTGSVYPGMLVHGATNAIALLLAVVAAAGTAPCKPAPSIGWEQQGGRMVPIPAPSADARFNCEHR